MDSCPTINHKRNGIGQSCIAILACIIICSTLFVALFKFADNILLIIHQLLDNIFPNDILAKILSLPFMSNTVYYTATFIIWLTVSACLCKKIYDSMNPKIINHNKEYILELFKDRKYGSPVPTREKLIEGIYGENKIDKNVEDSLNKLIDSNINPVKVFLSEISNKQILCINSKWGSGKTTTILIAINETTRDNLYIYESAFKYSGNMNEFLNDLLSSFKKCMSELGVRTNNIIDSLIYNLDSNVQKTIINLMKNREKMNIPSSELVLELNQRYRKSNNNKCIYIIIDDTDRLQGKDIMEILSVLSILKNLSFVKIIIPADLDIICRALENYKIVDAQKFIEKYLPSGMSLALYSGYDMARKIILDKIFYIQNNWDSSDNARPALAAIFFGMLAKRLTEETKNYDKIRYRWLYDELPGNTNETVSQLLQTPSIIRKQPNFETKYDWNIHYNNIQKFQNIIYAIRKKHGRNAPTSIAEFFSDEEYFDLVDSWIFDYMKKRWNIFGFTIRDALNMLESTNYRDLSKNPAIQFTYIFNQLFPEEQLQVKAQSTTNTSSSF